MVNSQRPPCPTVLILKSLQRGHSAIPYSDCGEEIMTAFLNDPKQSLDSSYVAGISPAIFTTDVYMSSGVYRLAKLLQGDLVNARLI
jgi:hypothetical protein